ncbi:MAG: OPT family oligopeptide transporter [Oceanipulchritudo sp.]
MEEPNRQKELTVRAVILGALLSIIMGAANVYLGLRAGITVTASIPAAVISMVLLRRVLRGGTILENNQVQTAASAGESLAAGVIFTLPALVMIQVWTDYNYWLSTAIALAGGMLGVLFMIPMRQVFIVKKDPDLKYPEGVACAEVLRAGETGKAAAAGARAILTGGLVGAGIKFAESFLGLMRGTLEGALTAGGRVFYFGTEALPALIGVGFIIRLSVAGSLFLGASLSWLIALPLMSAGLDIGTDDPLEAAYGLWSSKIRFIGVGAMLVGGILTVWRVRSGMTAAVQAVRRTVEEDTPAHERSLSMKWISLAAAIAVVLTGAIYYELIGEWKITTITTIIMLVAGFFFTAVASYIVGLVGNSNSPVSGMTITAVLFTGVLLLLFGFEGRDGMLATLGVAAVVCCIACTSGDVCNDLKTGQLVGATPYRQQIMQFVGVGVAAFFLAPVLSLLHENTPGGIGGEHLPAPQAALFASLARGFFGDGVLDWSLIGTGAAIGAALALADRFLERAGSPFRTHVMPVAVGMYLPFGISSAILLGGLLSWYADRRAAGAPTVYHRGMLFASGLIAGESLLGVGLALLAAFQVSGFHPALPPLLEILLTIAALLFCARLLVATARKAREDW